ncbi:hypothetical protein [Kushneria indalinina]|uniref:MFS transporter permease n=1 Tax=Kushneria indalinina DSM 14324 TaxID=1122140 RepID=A0A3D9DXX1_9GAMM|nr:hypothetical protein [Kushneria indalinina]REC95134.1 hypothetical protein C8D72_1969 [Kushneria indalinina DSM 14324]
MDYALGDFLMFTPEVYLRLFERTNDALGSWLWAVVAVLLAVPVLLYQPLSWGRRLVPVVMAAGWGLTAALFMMRFYAPINWPVGPFGWVFALQAGLLMLIALRAPPARVGLIALAGWGVVLLVLSWVTVHETGTWRSVALPGVTPDMTAAATAVLAMAWPRRWRWGLLVIPLLWCAFSALVHWALGLWWLLAVPVAGLCMVLTALAWPDRQR